MPKINFELSLLANRLGEVLDSPNFDDKLSALKAAIDYKDKNVLRINFLDSTRPELWCLEGLARYLTPVSNRHYLLDLIHTLPDLSVEFSGIPLGKTAWALCIQVDLGTETYDDSYFIDKVRNVIGFNNPDYIDARIYHGTEIHLKLSEPDGFDTSKDSALYLLPGVNSVVVTSLDPRTCAWLTFTMLCNYIDRGHTIVGIACSSPQKDILAAWEKFTISRQQILGTLGYMPEYEKFGSVLDAQHYKTSFDVESKVWYVWPPIFRFDIIHSIDILEDYLVATHYTEVRPNELEEINLVGLPIFRSALEERISGYLVAIGAQETIAPLIESYENVIQRMCHDRPQRLIRVANPINKNREYIIDSSLPPLLRNATHRSIAIPPLKLFLFTEVGFLEGSTAHSRWRMGILLVGSKNPFNDAHMLFNAICSRLKLGYKLIRNSSSTFIPGRQIGALADKVFIGQFGEIHPEVLTRWRLLYPTSFIELYIDEIETLLF